MVNEMPWPNSCDALRSACGAEFLSPTLFGSNERFMESHSQAVFEIAKRRAQPLFCDVQEEDEKENRMLEVVGSAQ
ncbi:hypothetical protein KIN20_027571 [Parelaphostrongylus tenuis]|uniref:Uncharacterized protein n=1 Tax=Parelaphostrongylus tenuis TaxID=148309 RepID=A0AAD5QZI3_PARTN|nr:hypothetical protein KIN20_027571 [Parelaphostrongylus tenuis]